LCGGTGHPRPHATLLVGALDPGTAVEHVEAVVGPERHPPLRLDAGAAHQHPGYGRLQVVVADVDGRDAAQLFERVPVAVEERSCDAVA